MRRLIRNSLVLWMLGNALSVLGPVRLQAADDDTAISVIFGEQHVTGAAFDMHLTAISLAPEERYAWLSRRLLPDSGLPSLRAEAALTPTDPGPYTTAINADRPDQIVMQRWSKANIVDGGRIVSPLFDLIDTARELGRLDEVRDVISGWNPETVFGFRVTGSSARESQDRQRRDAVVNRASALALIEIAAGIPDAAVPHLEQVLAETQSDAMSDPQPAPPDSAILLMLRAVDVPELREAAGIFLERYNRWARASEQLPMQRHIAALSGHIQVSAANRVDGRERADVATASQQWHVVKRSQAATRGNGCPNPEWAFLPGQIENVAGHDFDCVYFQSPLQGDFEVECDVSVSAWRATSLSVGGLWLGPVYHLHGIDSGWFRWQLPRSEFTPELRRVRHWVHYRTVARGGQRTTYFNGRPVHSQPIHPADDRWVAIHNLPRNTGVVRNLRITGSPSIPDSIKLLDDVALKQWCAYFDEPVGDPGDHWLIQNGELIGQRDAEPLPISTIGLAADSTSEDPAINEAAAGWRESLLRYHRPMFEDGAISWDFYYSPGEALVHPALDRLAFLITPDGVRVHQVTDGRYDRTGLGPDNVFDEPEHRRGPSRPPLKADEWNQLELRLHGNTVTLVLNGVEIFERPLEAGNRRTFGLFHFADQTGVRVRNLVWRGDWPRELPAVAQQELAAPTAEFLDDVTHLTAEFNHDFRTAGLPSDQFATLRGNPGTDLLPTQGGLQSTREGIGGYQNATVAPNMEIAGDFDIIVEYDRFEAHASVGGGATAALMAVLRNASADEFWIARRHNPKGEGAIDEICLCVVVQQFPEGERRNYIVTDPTEEKSGRLRLARRGNRLYYLSSENDSPNWILRGEQPIAADPVAADGLRLFTQIYQKGGSISVLWKRLLVRAEGLSGPAVGGELLELAELNTRREVLPARFQHDFTKQKPSESHFYTWGDVAEWKTDSNGWMIRSEGADSWTSAGIASHAMLTGDFDVTVTFNPVEMALPAPNKHTQVYLQLEGTDQDRRQVNSIFSIRHDGDTVATAQVREINRRGEYDYRPVANVGMAEIHRLRLVRRGSTVYFLASPGDETEDRIISRYEFNTLPIPARSIRFLVHTGGADRESTVALQHIDIRADAVQHVNAALPLQGADIAPMVPGNASPKPAPAKAAPAKGLLDRVLDFFK